MYKDAQRRGETVRQKILEVIVKYIESHGYPPTVREICELIGLKSTSTVQSHLKRMMIDGQIESDAGEASPRAIRVPGYKFIKVEDE